MTSEELIAHWGAIGRELPDGSVAVVERLTTTWSLILGVTEWEWHYRFCYAKKADAIAALETIQSENDVPEGWLACRPQVTVGHGRDERYPTPEELRQLRARARSGA